MVEILVTQDFMDWRDEKTAKYNRRGRSLEKFLMDLDCEIYEWFLINNEDWDDDEEEWAIDAIRPDGTRIDFKFLNGKWYNISCIKMLNHLNQEDLIDEYQFMEFVDRPKRPLQVGDRVEINTIGNLSYSELRSIIKVSHGKWGGFYADVRGYLAD